MSESIDMNHFRPLGPPLLFKPRVLLGPLRSLRLEKALTRRTTSIASTDDGSRRSDQFCCSRHPKDPRPDPPIRRGRKPLVHKGGRDPESNPCFCLRVRILSGQGVIPFDWAVYSPSSAVHPARFVHPLLVRNDWVHHWDPLGEPGRFDRTGPCRQLHHSDCLRPHRT